MYVYYDNKEVGMFVMSKKSNLFGGFFLFFLLTVNVSLLAQDCVSLNGQWKFAIAKTVQEAKLLENFYKPGFNSSKFEMIPVPSNWAILGYEEPVYRGFKDDNAAEGFYLYEFTTPINWTSKRVLLHFDGVWSSAEVWLNGICLGRHQGGYTSFVFDVTGKLKDTGNNQLAVRVRQADRGYKFDVYDDWTLGGIYRDVVLEAMPRDRWLDNLFVQTTFDSQFKDADLTIRTMVSDRHKSMLPGNYPSPGKPYDLLFTLSDKEGNTVAKRQSTIPAHIGTGRETTIVFHIEAPHHWTAETPYLYNLRVDLIENAKIVQTRTERVGFRQISTDDGVFRINGQAVKLRGINHHDEYPDVGRATTREHWTRDILMMKSANINYIRMAHYSHAKGFIELCDELGMYVGNEVSLGGAGDLMYDPSYSDAVMIRTYETIIRDMNSPSIIYWSVGNEDALTSLHLSSVKMVKALDPTRPVLLPWRFEEWLPKEIDILSAHYWQPQEYDQLAGKSIRPIISTEYTHAFGIDGFGGLEARWKALTKHPAGAGAAIWMWADQGLRTPTKRPKGKYDRIVKDDNYIRIDEAGWDGIVDSYRNATRDYWETKAVYAQVYPAIDKVSFTMGQKSVMIPIQNDFDFTNLNTIKIVWSLYEDGKILDTGTDTINGSPHTTTLFSLPTEKLRTICNGKTYYVRFIFIDGKDGEIVRKVVELSPRFQSEQQKESVANLLVKEADTVMVKAGETRYIFSPQTGLLSSAYLQSKAMITALKPIIWHPLDHGEISIIGRMARKFPDLNQYVASVKKWSIEQDVEKVIIVARVDYTVNEKNHFTVDYCYIINTSGQLTVRYSLLPHVQTTNLPVVGMSLQSPSELNRIHWLGLGPYDAYPNKQSAPILGLWGGNAGSMEVVGNKATRWIERSDSTGTIRITHNGYMEHEASTSEIITILSSVLSKPEKGRKPDNSMPLLDTKTGDAFAGEFSIELKRPLQSILGK